MEVINSKKKFVKIIHKKFRMGEELQVEETPGDQYIERYIDTALERQL